ncbi:FAD/NAD(P)-binding domain-containing protein [Meredithblackwellia eburnea MCA 4105]
MPSVNEPLRVALIGGGLGGLSFAIALLRAKEQHGAPIQFDLFEGAKQFAEIGAGIGMGQNAFEVMRFLGLEKEYNDIADPCERCQWRYGEAGRPQGPENKLGENILLHSTVHRAELLDIMVKKVPSSVAHFGKRLISYSQDGAGSPITLSFEDGTTHVCDVLVGGDGVKSVVRDQLYANEKGVDASPRYTGTTAARGILPMETVQKIVGVEEATRPQMYLGVDQHLLIFPIQQGKTVNVVAFKSDRSVPDPIWTGGAGVAPISHEELLSGWSHWHERCQGILKAIPQPSQWALIELRDLPFHAKGSVCLIGDAAHASLPHQGAGAGQALEDGVVLAELLSHPSINRETIPRAMDAYNYFRRDRSTRVKTTSNELGVIMEFKSPEFKEDREKIVANLQVRYDHIWQWSPFEEVKRVRAYLDERVKA